MKTSALSSLGADFDFDEIRQRLQSATSKLQATDPALAKKLNSITKEVSTLTKAGRTLPAALTQALKDNGSLSTAEVSELKSALGSGASSVADLLSQASGTDANLQGASLGSLIASKYQALSGHSASDLLSSLGKNGIQA